MSTVSERPLSEPDATERNRDDAAERASANVPSGAVCPRPTLAWHLARGVIGLALVVAAFVLAEPTRSASILLAVPALVLWGGCPTCWLAGLGTRLAARRRAS